MCALQVEIMHAVEDIVKIIKAYHLDDHLERVQEEVSVWLMLVATLYITLLLHHADSTPCSTVSQQRCSSYVHKSVIVSIMQSCSSDRSTDHMHMCT
jgi:hypothetical protein